MRGFKHFCIILICVMAASAHGKQLDTDIIIKGCCTVRLQEYSESTSRHKESSRYDLEIMQPKGTSYNWDFTLDDDPNYHYTSIGNLSPVPNSSTKHPKFHVVLHQYDFYEERVTFNNLNLGPISSNAVGIIHTCLNRKFDITPRYLSLKNPLTVTTPSGITITLPTQGAETLDKVFSCFNGNPNALFIPLKTSPDKNEVLLPLSPLYKKHQKPVRIKMESPQPNYMVHYLADNSYNEIAIGLPNLKTVKHLDKLTLIIRQRVDLQTIPITIKAPAYLSSTE